MIKLLQPVKGKLLYAPEGIISQKFGECATSELCAFYESLGLKSHNGIDFAGEKGTPIYAAHDGLIVASRESSGTIGKNIAIQSPIVNNRCFITVYYHNDSLLVSEGQGVIAGQVIAKMGNSGSSPQFYMAVHSHFGLYEATDPVPYTFQLNFGTKSFTIINGDNGYHGAKDPLPYLLSNIMDYIILPNNEQYLLYEPLKIAFNIGDPIELGSLKLQGLTGEPVSKADVNGYKIYPLVSKDRLKDLFGL